MDDPARQARVDAPGSTSFVLGGSDEEWLRRVRAARETPALGSLGSYELLEVVARGGQGIVYRAVQSGTGRTVAVKRLLTGSVAEGTARARFEREIRVDAALKHPNIVSVYGVEFVGDQPVLVMEWIEGVPIDSWARAAGRDAVLATFLKVCDAVQHGHQRGVIHRDLKPSNILVDGAGEPHVVDFGLARLAEDAGEDRARLTVSGAFVGTLAYAPPEQLRGEPDAADVRTDVYALGCVLFRCLTGRLPFEPDADLESLVHRICQTDPARASSIDRSLAGDLDAILGRALARDREHRYPTVEAFGADLRRHLAHEPVLARPASAAYQLRRFARRHRALVAGGTALILVLAGAATVSTVLYLRSERDRALSSAVYEFMHQVLTSVEPQRDVTLEEAIDKAAHEVEGAFAGRPAVEADVRHMIAEMYERLGFFEKARAQHEARLPLLEYTIGPNAEPTLDAAHSIGDALYRAHRPGDGVPWLRRALAGRSAALGPDHEKTLETTTTLALCLNDAGARDEAETLHRQALAICRRTLGPSHERTLKCMNNLALSIMFEPDKKEEAESLFRQVLEGLERAEPPPQPDTAITMYNLARRLDWDTQAAEVERLLRGAVDGARSAWQADHPVVIQFQTHLGEFLIYRDRLDEAEPLLTATLAAAREHLGEEVPTMHAQMTLGWLFKARGRFEEAEGLIRPAYEWFTQHLGPESSFTDRALKWLVALYDAWGKPELAAKYREATRPPNSTP